MKKKLGWMGIGMICLALLAGAASAQSAPQLINYQGRLANALGQPPAEGATVDLTFKFYSAATGGTLYLTIIQEDVVVTGGLYNVLIGSGTIAYGTEISLANVFSNHSEVWLGVAVDAEAEMIPRSRIASVPYALNCAALDFSAMEKFYGQSDYDGDGHEKVVYEGDDCDDSEPLVYTGAPEVCDGLDNQCYPDPGYGQVDEGCGACVDLDADGRGWGCGSGPDCDDLDANNWLSCATCSDFDGDGSFADCDEYATPLAGPDCDDLDLNNWGACATCNDNDLDGYYELCDQYLSISGPDCDDLDLNNWSSCANCLDGDTDTYFAGCDAYLSISGPDCDDSREKTYPGAPETCLDYQDNQCPGDSGYGTVDEGCPMAFIPAGCFDMGDAFSEGNSDELPVHNVCITSNFYMDVHEVTNAQYKACVDASGCTAPSQSSSHTRSPYYGNPTYDNFPVIYVDWNQATAYCTWAGKRLPTEAEWEYAARGGLSGKRFPWGDTISCANANYSAAPSTYSYDVNPTGGYCIGDTSSVGSYAANGYGLYDMAGNVWEWTNDWYSSTYYGSSPPNDPSGPSTGTYRVLRGGGCFNGSDNQRIAFRDIYLYPTGKSNNLGLRCVAD